MSADAGLLNTQLNPLESLTVQALNYLWDRWAPRPGQKILGNAVFGLLCKIIFIRFGRNGGKTHGGMGCAIKFAIENPGSRVFYFLPTEKQVLDIIWQPKLWEEFLDPDFIARFDNENHILELKNGSFLRFCGSSIVWDARGIKPDLVIADEYADFDPEWATTFFPNLLGRDAPIVMMGTPPEYPITEEGKKHHYVLMDEMCQRQMKTHPHRVFWAWLPTWVANPKISAESLEFERLRLKEEGEEHKYWREYGAHIVTGSSKQIFPMISKERHLTPYEPLAAMVRENRNRFELWVGGDPATKSVFAVNFVAIDHYTAKPYWLREIHETDASQTVAQAMNRRIYDILTELGWELSDCEFVCDSAAASYIEESDAEPNYPISWTPIEKQHEDKLQGLNDLKTVLLNSEHVISEECMETYNEFMLYRRDKNGRIPKKNDHHIDLSRYILKASGFDFKTSEPKKPKEEDPEENNYLMPAHLAKAKKDHDNDWTRHVLEGTN